MLKARGYRWGDSASGAAQAWWTDVLDVDKDVEQSFLEREAYLREIDFKPRRIDTYNQFSDRC